MHCATGRKSSIGNDRHDIIMSWYYDIIQIHNIFNQHHATMCPSLCPLRSIQSIYTWLNLHTLHIPQTIRWWHCDNYRLPRLTRTNSDLPRMFYAVRKKTMVPNHFYLLQCQFTSLTSDTLWDNSHTSDFCAEHVQHLWYR